ncbi:MAG: glycosyltransferase family 2 protein, partial [Candidatus Omnitrophica bacterium]|nr:glycosyltransferase family 2 protein [Candidatus Omnitrophota bacterium]
MPDKKLISIVIRTKNEERWITPCLQAVFSQDHKDVEVIVVDNHSTDKTVEKAKRFPVKVVQVDDYLPGKALNVGFNAASGEYIVCLSAHCVPVNAQWLTHLLVNFEDKHVAGVYGR